MIHQETEGLLRRHLEELSRWILQLVQPREFVDGSIVRAHQHTAGASKGAETRR